MKFIKKFVRDTKAATAIEYGLIAALIAVAGIAAMTRSAPASSRRSRTSTTA